MRLIILSLILLTVPAAVAVGWILTTSETVGADALPAHEPDAEAGRLVFIAGGCASCHAAPGAEGEAKLVLEGGLELKTDFGTFVAPNISSDPNVGIGDWTMAEFVTAMVKGTRPDGRHYFPSFPYTSYARMEVPDLMDLRTYLATLPASFNVPPPHDLDFPFGIRRGVGLWKRLYLDPTPVLADAGTAQLQRGRYLVEGPGHCGECHTPRDAFGGPDRTRWLSGAENPDGPGRIPNITPGQGGIGGWSETDIAYYLETGFDPDFDSAGGSMTAVIANTSQLPAEDRAAIAAYLKAIPPIADGD